MPSPFPGMDPYLENPVMWPGFHNRYIAYLSAQLNSVLPESYVANIEERLYITEAERSIVPDVSIREQLQPNRPIPGLQRQGIAVFETAPMPYLLDVSDEPTTETYIQVKQIHGPIVTIIEVLSFSNKSPNTEGNRLYLQKQREILENEINLLEIDLLRRGQHSVSAPNGPMTMKFDPWDYLVCLSRHVNRQQYLLWLISLRESLPRINVPLRGTDADVEVDLQTVFTRVFEEGAYNRLIQYAEPPYSRLKPEDSDWANQLLHLKGLVKS